MSFGLLVLLVVVGTTIWVGVDASRRDWSGRTGTAGWVIGCILLWIVFFPYYLVVRGKVPLKEAGAAAPNWTSPSSDGVPVAYRECPHCKEGMRRDASHCPHCRQPSTPWHYHEGRWWLREREDGPWEWLDEQTGEWVTFDPAAE